MSVKSIKIKTSTSNIMTSANGSMENLQAYQVNKQGLMTEYLTHLRHRFDHEK